MPRPAAPCGTHAAYLHHIRRHETPDDDCLDAHAEYMRQWRQRRAAGQPERTTTP